MLIGTREALGVGMAVLPKVGGGGLAATVPARRGARLDVLEAIASE